MDYPSTDTMFQFEDRSNAAETKYDLPGRGYPHTSAIWLFPMLRTSMVILMPSINGKIDSNAVHRARRHRIEIGAVDKTPAFPVEGVAETVSRPAGAQFEAESMTRGVREVISSFVGKWSTAPGSLIHIITPQTQAGVDAKVESRFQSAECSLVYVVRFRYLLRALYEAIRFLMEFL